MDRKRLDKIMADNNLDVVISIAPQTRLWFAKLSMSETQPLFLEKDNSYIFADGRYIEYAKTNAKNVKNVELFNGENIKNFAKDKESEYKRIGFEKEYLSISQMSMLKNWFPNAEFVGISGKELRIIKTKDEIELVRKACEISLKSLEELKPMIKAGMTEKDLDAELEYLLRKNGADKSSFDAIIASGPNSSKPHYRAGQRVLQEGDQLKIDFGVLYNGYASDITRTISVGELKDEKLKEINAILTEAQDFGKTLVGPGVSTVEIDQKIRDFITEKGYGKEFVHSTGHGLGIDVHELPNVTSNKAYETILEPGMIITIEPGIYIEGLGGIRIEDDVLVTEDGYEVLSKLK